MPDTCLPAGFHPVPRGHVATIVTHLAMDRPDTPPLAPDHSGLRLRPLERQDTSGYRSIFRAVGTDWLWFSRLRLEEPALRAILTDPAVEAFVAEREGEPIGLLELDFRAAPEAELAYFGLVPGQAGQGLGRWLMAQALARVWDPARNVSRLTVHTCTLDSAAALPFYLRSGFTALRQEVEIAPDPRLDGTLPAGAAPQIPLLG